MTTAKPIQRPTGRTGGRQNRNHATIPIVAVREPDNGREQKRFDLSSRDHKKQHSLPSNEKPPQDETRPDKRVGKCAAFAR